MPGRLPSHRGPRGLRGIERRPDPREGRALGAYLTPAGAAALRSGQERLLEVEGHMLRGLSGADREALRDLLRPCIESLRETLVGQDDLVAQQDASGVEHLRLDQSQGEVRRKAVEQLRSGADHRRVHGD